MRKHREIYLHSVRISHSVFEHPYSVSNNNNKKKKTRDYPLWLLLTVLWVGLQCVIVVFPVHTHLLLEKIMHSRPHFTLKSVVTKEEGICYKEGSPPVKYFTDHSKAVLLLWIFFCLVFAMPLCASVYMWSPAGKGLTDLLALVCCVQL